MMQNDLNLYKHLHLVRHIYAFLHLEFYDYNLHLRKKKTMSTTSPHISSSLTFNTATKAKPQVNTG